MLRRLADAKALSQAAADRAVARLPHLAILTFASGARACTAAGIEAFTVDHPEVAALLDALDPSS